MGTIISVAIFGAICGIFCYFVGRTSRKGRMTTNTTTLPDREFRVEIFCPKKSYALIEDLGEVNEEKRFILVHTRVFKDKSLRREDRVRKARDNKETGDFSRGFAPLIKTKKEEGVQS